MDIDKINKNNDNKSFPAVSITRKDPQLAAQLSKLERRTNYSNSNLTNSSNFNTTGFNSILSKRSKSNSDASAIQKLLPDIALSKQIMVSCVLSPKDMTSVELVYLPPKNLLDSNLSSSMINKIKNYFEDDYKIKSILTNMLEEALFDKGSYPIAVLPEHVIDEYINGTRAVSLEGFRSQIDSEGRIKTIGILGNPYSKTTDAKKTAKISLESINKPSEQKYDSRLMYNEKQTIAYEEYINITDNVNILRLPKLNSLLSRNAVKEQYSKHSLSLSIEDNELKDYDIEKLIFRTRSNKTKTVAEMPSSVSVKRKTIGKPLIMKLPSESVIPVHVPGNVRQQIGYFILLDQEGNPIESADGDHDYSNVNKSDNCITSSLIKKVETNIGGNCSFDGNNKQHTAMMSKLHSDLIEKDLINRVKNGIHTSDVQIAKNEHVYRIMLSRVLSKQFTQILYLPAEYVTYVAFNYNDSGIGKSLLDDTMTINTLRATMMFTDMLSSIKNSIGRTKVTVNVPPNDPNPEKTVEEIMDKVVASRAVNLPMGISNPNDIFAFIQKAGYEFQFEGHTGLPDLKLDFQQTQSSYAKGDSELQDNLRKSSISGLGLTPEIVDNGFASEFATTSIANNVLMSKRVINIQEAFTPQVSDHLRKVAFCSGDLIEDLRAILNQNIESIKIELDEEEFSEKIDQTIKNKIIVNRALNDFIGGFYVELNKPKSVTLVQQLDDLKMYIDAMDTTLEAYVSDTFITSSTSGDVANEVNTIKALIKAHFIRKWLSERGIMSELSDLTSCGEDGKPLFNLAEITKQHLESLSTSGLTTLSSLKTMIENNNKQMSEISSSGQETEDLDKQENATGEEPDTVSSSETETDKVDDLDEL